MHIVCTCVNIISILKEMEKTPIMTNDTAAFIYTNFTVLCKEKKNVQGLTLSSRSIIVLFYFVLFCEFGSEDIISNYKGVIFKRNFFRQFKAF